MGVLLSGDAPFSDSAEAGRERGLQEEAVEEVDRERWNATKSAGERVELGARARGEVRRSMGVLLPGDATLSLFFDRFFVWEFLESGVRVEGA